MIGPHRRSAILDALRRGTVPREGLDAFAVGMERFEPAVDLELAAVAGGRGGFKAVRGEYGSGKTFFARWLQERARATGFAASEVQVSETETPLHRWETVYRRLVERLATADTPDGALRSTVDGWFYTLEEDVLAAGSTEASDTACACSGDRGVDGTAAVGNCPYRPGFLSRTACLPPSACGGRRGTG